MSSSSPSSATSLKSPKSRSSPSLSSSPNAPCSPSRIRVAVVEIHPTPEGKRQHPGAENIKRAIWAAGGGSGASSSGPKSNLALDVRFVTTKQLTSVGGRKFFESDFHVLVMPGGSSGQQARALGAAGRATIKRFVAGGGGYLGICAGAYLALSDYKPERSLKLLRATALTDWERGHFIVPVTLSLRGAALLLAPPEGGGKTAEGEGKDGEEPLTPPSGGGGGGGSGSGSGSGSSKEVVLAARFNNGPCMMVPPYPAKAGVADSGDGEEEEKKEDAEEKDEEEKEENSAAEAASPRKNPGRGPGGGEGGEGGGSDALPAPGEATVLGTFEQGLRGGEDAKSVGTGAVVVGAYGNGRVILISPHMESTDARAAAANKAGEEEKGGGVDSVVLPHMLLSKAPENPDAVLQMAVKRAVLWAAGFGFGAGV